jgi:hypothetical protein
MQQILMALPRAEMLIAPQVGLPGLEPGTSSLSEKRSNRLSYRPAKCKARIIYTTLVGLTTSLQGREAGSKIGREYETASDDLAVLRGART